MTPYFFPPPFHCCLSEKEIQLECLSDGEIGSVVFAHFPFFVSLRPSDSSPPSSLFHLFVFVYFEQWCLRCRLWPFPSCPIFCSSSIHASPSAYKRHQNLFNSDNTHTHAHTLTSFQLSYSDVWPICLWIGSGILAYLPTSLNITGATRDILIIENISIKSFSFFNYCIFVVPSLFFIWVNLSFFLPSYCE